MAEAIETTLERTVEMTVFAAYRKKERIRCQAL
jgi:hypothetical protein